MKASKFVISAATIATIVGCTCAPAFADVIGGTAYSAQTTTISAANDVLSPTGVSAQSTWIYVTLPGTTIPVDPPILQY